jgi:DNA-binding MarR family transcriptional regulator
MEGQAWKIKALEVLSLAKPKPSRSRVERSTATDSRIISPHRIELRRRAVARAFDAQDKHAYFEGVAEARYVLRKAFRIVEERAKAMNMHPLAHQALIQIYGSRRKQLRINELAHRLDIAPAFASNLARTLSKRKLITRTRNDDDQRVIVVRVTEAGRELLHAIDAEVKVHVDYFTRTLTAKDRESALSILMFYVGVSMSTARKKRMTTHVPASKRMGALWAA